MIFAIPCYMASLARSAPVPQRSALVEDPEFVDIVQISNSLTTKILMSIPDAHDSSIRSKALQLNSPENSKFEQIALEIGIHSAPQLRAVSESFSLEACLRSMCEGLQLHQALLKSVTPRLQNGDKVKDLLPDIRDLVIQINKMLKMVQGEALVQPTPTPMTLNLPGDYEVQIAAHLTLVQLQSFGQDMVRVLRNLVPNDEETQS
ncbi:colony stimulating factor 3 (granulocyte) a isoform X2 [Antennarius striatus]|uniref:colony stimulating factor 3 (granulocyte) a isoform X2 n=1 Tax=Antennarius striatus TaxID=241820 RepID=UPI0035B1BF0F